MVLNGVGLIGRVLPNYAAQQWFGPLNTVIPITFAASIVLFSWIAVNTVTGLWIFATFYGLTAAGIQGLFPVVLTSLTTDQKKAGVRAGMAFSVVVSLSDAWSRTKSYAYYIILGIRRPHRGPHCRRVDCPWRRLIFWTSAFLGHSHVGGCMCPALDTICGGGLAQGNVVMH